MIFASDNWAGASDPVMTAVAEAARRGAPAYGHDDLTRAAIAHFAEIFEREVAVFFVATGTAANALGLAAFARPGGFVLCHRHAHVITYEMGATEFFGGGTRLVGLDGPGATIAAETLADALVELADATPPFGEAVAVSLSQPTELGVAYRPDTIAALGEAAHRRGLAVHMDGARFASAVAALDVRPADLTWRAGVDVMSFGGTKNGCLAAEAVVFFDPDRARSFAAARQRAGHGFSKNWFAAAQFAAYLDGGHWLDLARRANGRAAGLAAAIEASRAAHLAWRPDGNQVFAVLTSALDDRLKAAGAIYYEWPDADGNAGGRRHGDEVLVRLVASHATTEEEVDRFAAIVAG